MWYVISRIAIRISTDAAARRHRHTVWVGITCFRPLVAIGLWVIAASALASPVQAADLGGVPVPTSLTVNEFATDRFRVTVQAERNLDGTHSVCVEAIARTPHGANGLEVEFEESCFEETRTSTYRFAPVRWVASVSGTVKTVWTRLTYQRSDDDTWVLVSERDQASTAGVDLHWAGTGPQTVNRPIATGLPLTCLAFPPICMSISTAVSRTASARGSIAFNGIGIVASLPRGQSGTMTVGA